MGVSVDGQRFVGEFIASGRSPDELRRYSEPWSDGRGWVYPRETLLSYARLMGWKWDGQAWVHHEVGTQYVRCAGTGRAATGKEQTPRRNRQRSRGMCAVCGRICAVSAQGMIVQHKDSGASMRRRGIVGSVLRALRRA